MVEDELSSSEIPESAALLAEGGNCRKAPCNDDIIKSTTNKIMDRIFITRSTSIF